MSWCRTTEGGPVMWRGSKLRLRFVKFVIEYLCLGCFWLIARWSSDCFDMTENDRHWFIRDSPQTGSMTPALWFHMLPGDGWKLIRSFNYPLIQWCPIDPLIKREVNVTRNGKSDSTIQYIKAMYQQSIKYCALQFFLHLRNFETERSRKARNKNVPSSRDLWLWF